MISTSNSNLSTTLSAATAVLSLNAPSSLAGPEDSVSDQLWVNYILAFPQSEKLYYELDLETANQVSGGEPWHTAYGTGMVEYYPSQFIDLTGELVTGFTYQTAAEESYELSTRLGMRLHFFKTLIDSYNKGERFSSRRYGLANLMRFEQRNFWYSSDRPSSHSWRFRNRLEFRYALNKPDLARDGVWDLIADWEWFLPLSNEEAPERFSNLTRGRFGAGYRWKYRWRYELLLQRDQDRDTLEEEFSVDAYAIDLRVKMFL